MSAGKCCTGDWRRTGPDCVVHLPERPGLWEYDHVRVFWYADRQQFVPGKEIPDELLADMTVPES